MCAKISSELNLLEDSADSSASNSSKFLSSTRMSEFREENLPDLMVDLEPSVPVSTSAREFYPSSVSIESIVERHVALEKSACLSRFNRGCGFFRRFCS